MARPLQLCYLFVVAILLSACTGGRSTVIEFIDKETAECARQLEAGELQNHEYRAYCESWAIKRRIDEAALDYTYGDLIALMAAKRMRLARQMDAGTLTNDEAESRYAAFYTGFLKALEVREKRSTRDAESWQFNFCELVDENLQCILPPKSDFIIQGQDKFFAACDQRRESRMFESFEAYVRCKMDALKWAIAQTPINNDLSWLLIEVSTGLAMKVDSADITEEQFVDRLVAYESQSQKERYRRDQRRASGDLNWHRRKCVFVSGLLECTAQ